MNILVIAPHPDDEIIGCGGSIINHVNNNHAVKILYLTSGDAGDHLIPKENLSEIREKEAIEGLKVLGVDLYEFLHMPDGNISLSTDNISKLAMIIRSSKPDVLYIPHANDSHRDHRKTYSLSTESVFRAEAGAYQEITGEKWTVPIVLTYEVWTPLEKYQYTEDITTVIEQKINALKCHKTQLANVSYDEAVRGLNRYRGALSQKSKYCECFGIVKITKI